jgi:cellulose synthase/poly-beta-1,6-N-acetylglucosamine synthase-like glycosyltransferase
MKISLIHPSRGRADKSVKTLEQWLMCAGPVTMEVILSLDNSDPSIASYQSNYFKSILRHNTIILKNDNDSVVQAANHAAKASMGDVLVYVSDDFFPPINWAKSLVKEFENETRPLLLKVDDCLQKFSARVLTIPIMNRSLYEKLGYFFHPEYKSMWVDCDLFETVHKIGAIKNAEHIKFPHEHHCIGKAPNDETYRRSEANWNQGKKIFDMRKRLGFPI